MKVRGIKLAVSLVATAICISIPLSANADTAVTVDGISGSQAVNGYYKTSNGYPSLAIELPAGFGGTCSAGTVRPSLTPATPNPDGAVTWHLEQDPTTGGLALQNSLDGNSVTVTTCNPPSVNASYQEIWSDTVKYDSSPPAVKLTAPTAAITTTANAVVVAGTVNDSGSGVAAVYVNGSKATLIGSNFTVTVPLSAGDNPINVYAVDNVGFTSSTQTVMVTRNVTGTPAVTSDKSNKNDPTAQPNYDAYQSHPSTNGAKKAAATKSVAADNVAVRVGVGATLMVLALVGLFLFDRFGILRLPFVHRKKPVHIRRHRAH